MTGRRVPCVDRLRVVAIAMGAALLVSACDDQEAGSSASRSTETVVAPTTTVPEILRGLPDPNSCGGNTHALGDCLGDVYTQWRGRLESELRRVHDDVESYLADSGPDLPQISQDGAVAQLETLDRLVASWPEEVGELCAGLRGIEGSWRGIDTVSCEITLIRETLLVLASMEH